MDNKKLGNRSLKSAVAQMTGCMVQSRNLHITALSSGTRAADLSKQVTDFTYLHCTRLLGPLVSC